MFKVKMPEVDLVIHTRLEPVIYRMKLNNRVIHTIEARLIHKIETISVAYARPGRHQHFISATSYEPVGLESLLRAPPCVRASLPNRNTLMALL